jgi:hypothetical protein
VAEKHRQRWFAAISDLLKLLPYQRFSHARKLAKQMHIGITSNGVRPLMTRFLPLILITTSGFLLAQQPVPGSNGGWRRADDPPPTSAQAPPQNPEPVARDQYGQQAPASVPDAPPNDQDAVSMPAPPPEMPQQAPPQSLRPAYGLPRILTLKSGAYITVRMNQGLSSDHSHIGDTFTATLMQPVVIDGVVVAQRGQTVYGHVSDVQKQKTDKPSFLRLQLNSLTVADGAQVPITSQLVTRQGGNTPAGVQAGTVFGTTAVGAAIGGAAAWGTGAAIGAGAGAAAGIIGVLVTRHHPTIVYPESALTFQVTSPITVSTERAPQAFRFVGPEDYQQTMTYAARPGPGPRPGYPAYPGGYYYGGPAYGYPYPYPYYYGYPYWGPSVGVYWGGWGYRRWR